MKLGNAEITVSPEDINQAVENYLESGLFPGERRRAGVIRG